LDRVETKRVLVKQLRFLNVNRNSREAIVAVNGVLIEMKIIEHVALLERQTIARAIRLLGYEEIPKQFNFQACLDSLMICARDVSGANIVSEGVVDLEQFITKPRAVKRQLPKSS
jgi:hypothetical protein